jgi:imidazolonepropionase-like amidohydrolase
MTLNGAVHGRDKLIGSIATGKQADLVVIAGDPSTRASDQQRRDRVQARRWLRSREADRVRDGKTGLW